MLAQRKTEIQINVDATAVAQAGNGASYLRTAIFNEVQNFISKRGDPLSDPINLVVRAKFNPNLKTAWFSAMTQVINQITLLTVISHRRGADPRARAGHCRTLIGDARRACRNHARENACQRSRHSGCSDAVAAVRGSSVDRCADCGSIALFLLARRSTLWWWPPSASCSARCRRRWASSACSPCRS